MSAIPGSIRTTLGGRFEITGAPQRLYSNHIRGIRSLPARIVN